MPVKNLRPQRQAETERSAWPTSLRQPTAATLLRSLGAVRCTDRSDCRVGPRVLVFRPRRDCPDRACGPVELSVGTGGALASPIAIGQGGCNHPYGADRFPRDARVRCGRRAGNILVSTAATGVPFQPRGQNSLASGGRTGWRDRTPRNSNGPGTRSRTDAIRNPDRQIV